MTTLKDMQAATLAARARTGDQSIATRVSKGMFQIVRVTYDAYGKSTVEALSPYAPAGWVTHRLGLIAIENGVVYGT